MYSEIFLALIACSVIVLAAFGLGRVVFSGRLLAIVGLELLALQCLAGLGALGVALFVIGSFRWGRVPVCFVVIPLAVLGLWSLWDCAFSGSYRQLSRYCVAILMLATCGLASVSLPVGDIGNDSISYHLVGPTKWPEIGRIVPFLDHSHTAFPATVETLFAAGVILSNARVAGALDVVFALLLLVQLRGLALFLRPGVYVGPLVVTFAATMPVVMNLSNNGFVDVAYACFALAAVRVAIGATGSWWEACAVGLFSGFAVGTKYTGIIFAGVLVGSVLFFSPCGDSLSRRFRRCFLSVAVAGFVGCPWYIRDWLVLGSPIYPIPLALARFFNSPHFPLAAVIGFHRYILDRGKGLGTGLQWFVALPFTFTFFTAYFHGAGGIGLTPLCFGPAGGIVMVRDRRARFLALLILLLSFSWFVTQQEARFLMPVVCLCTVFAAIGAPILLWQKSFLGRAVSWLVVAVSICYGGWIVLDDQLPRIASLAGPAAEEKWRDAGVPYWAAFDYLNRTADVRNVLILDSSVPPYYLDKRYVKPLGPYGEISVAGLSATSAVSELEALGVTHILDVEGGLYSSHFQVPESSGLPIVFSGGGARVYRVVADR